MLGKIIKYDFKSMSRSMFPVFGAMIALSILISVMIKFGVNVNALWSIVTSLTFMVFSGSLFLTIILIIQRFVKGLLRDEGYLSFALPVSTLEHVIAKMINLIIWSILEGLALLLCALIFFLINMNSINELIEIVSVLFRIDLKSYAFLARLLLTIILGLISTGSLIYAAYSIGHLAKKHKRIVGIGFYVIFMVIYSYITTEVLFPLFFNNTFEQIDLVTNIINIISIIITTFITWYVLDRNLNLE